MKKRRNQILISISIFVMTVYLVWRLFNTLPSGWSLLIGIPLLIVEAVSIFQSLFFHIILFNPTTRKPLPLPQQLQTVDVTIATYNEPPALVRKTVLACLNLDYPKELINIWVCDDGKREEMRVMTEQLGVHYLTRSTNEHAKAGNLNHALKHLKGDLLLLLDADMMPKPEFLQRTAGFFAANEKLAFVQTPQVFYNEDIFQYNYYQGRKIPHEQDMFMRLIQTGRDRYNATVFVGSNTLFRRSALNEIGGFVTGTITEDLATGMILQSRGYDTYALNEVLAMGLSSESISDQVKQRTRWARGTIQTVRKWNPLRIKGLSFMQRMLYLSNLLYWYFGFTRFIFMLAPFCYFMFGANSLETNLTELLIFWLPHFLFSLILMPYITNQKLNTIWNTIYEISMAPSMLLAALTETVTKKEIPFHVTPKGVFRNKTTINIRYIAPLLIFLLISLIVFGLNVHRAFAVAGVEQQQVIVNLFWVLFNIVALSLAIPLGLERPRLRGSERFSRTFSVHLQLPREGEEFSDVTVRTLDVSEQGIRVLASEMIDLPQRTRLLLETSVGVVEVDGEKVFYDKHPEGFQAGFKLVFPDLDAERMWLNAVNASTDDYVKGTFDWSIGRSILQYIRHFQFRYHTINRGNPRVMVNKRAILMTGGRQQHRVRLIDLSFKGSLIEIPAKAAVMDDQSIEIHFIGSTIKLTGRLVRVQPEGTKHREAGVIFDGEISPALIQDIQLMHVSSVGNSPESDLGKKGTKATVTN